MTIMPERRRCESTTLRGTPCGAPPLRGGTFCFHHDPEHAAQAAEARVLGGKRRRREARVSAAFDLDDLDRPSGQARLIAVVELDTLALENSPARARAIAHLVTVRAKLYEQEVLDRRLQALEEARD